MERIAAITSSLFPIDLLSIIFLSEIFPERQFEVLVNDNYDEGKPENRRKVARGSLPTFNWEQEGDQTWRLLHIPIEQLKKSDSIFSVLSHEYQKVINNQCVDIKNIFTVSEAINSSATASEFYIKHLKHIYKQNSVSKVIFSDFSRLRNGEIPRDLKEDLFRSLKLISNESPKKFSRGGKICCSYTSKTYDYISSYGDEISLYYNEGKGLKEKLFDLDEFLESELSLTGNLEMLLFSGSNYKLGHIPWYTHIDTASKIFAYEVITPISCHDHKRSGASSGSFKLSPSGYSLLDYTTIPVDLLMEALLGSGSKQISPHFIHSICKKFPDSKEKLSNHQGAALNRITVSMQRTIKEAIQTSNLSAFESTYNISIDSIAIERLFLYTELLDIARDWITDRSPRVFSDASREYIKRLTGKCAEDITIQQLMNEVELRAKDVDCWLLNRGASVLPVRTTNEITGLDNVAITEKIEINSATSRVISKYLTSARATWGAYLRFAAFFAGVVLKADVFRLSLMSEEFVVSDHIRQLIESRDIKYFDHGLKFLDD